MRRRRVQVTFERGGQCVLELFDDLAPRNCEEIWRALPLRTSMVHAIFSGLGIFGTIADVPVAEENQRLIGLPAGTLGIEYFPAGLRSPGQRTGLVITYGSMFSYRNPFTVCYPLSVIGQATALEGLAEVGERIWARGRETVEFAPCR